MRDIAGQYGVSRSALSRHKTNHLPRLVEAAKACEEAQAVTSGAALIDELDRLLERALAILEAAEGSGQLRVALQAIREARETIKICADLAVTAELEERVEELEELIEQRGGLRSV
jgi:flagellar biosynthesis/type III secretory pathway chaperone